MKCARARSASWAPLRLPDCQLRLLELSGLDSATLRYTARTKAVASAISAAIGEICHSGDSSTTALDPNTRLMARALDYETVASYSLTVAVTDAHCGRRRQEARWADVRSRCAGVYRRLRCLRVAEDVASPTGLGTVSARDSKGARRRLGPHHRRFGRSLRGRCAGGHPDSGGHAGLRNVSQLDPDGPGFNARERCRPTRSRGSGGDLLAGVRAAGGGRSPPTANRSNSPRIAGRTAAACASRPRSGYRAFEVSRASAFDGALSPTGPPCGRCRRRRPSAPRRS